MTEGIDPVTGKFLPGNKLAVGNKKNEIDLRLALEGMREHFPPDKWGERLEEIWRVAGTRGSAKTQLMVLQFVADRLIGKPVQSVTVEKNETKRIIAMLADMPVFTVETEEQSDRIIDIDPDETL